MSNRAVEQQNFDEQDPFAGLALVTRPVPKAEPGHVVVRITLRPVNPTDLISISSNTLRIPGVSSNRLRIPGSEGFGIVHEVKQASSFSSVSCNFVGKYHRSFLSLCVSAHLSSLLWNCGR
jgi:NADPH:quinone reductase-like Zn-dependent oxidoreductase